MITIEETSDKEYIKSIFLHPEITNAMRDDSVPENIGEVFTAAMDRLGGFCLKVLMDGVACGVFWLRPDDNGFEAHTALLPSCRGKNAVKAARMAIKWVFEHTEAPTISSYAWSDCPAVEWFCRAVGMHPFATRPWPNTRNGNAVNITYFKINRI